MLKSARKPSTRKGTRKLKVASTKESRFLDRREDVEEFAAAARAYTKAKTKDKKTALAALQKMGIVTSTGRLTKHYK